MLAQSPEQTQAFAPFEGALLDKKIMKTIIIIVLLSLAGCASMMQRAEPYFDVKMVWQNDSGTDWMLRSARPWVEDGRFRSQFGVGIEWDKGWDCPYLQVSPFQSLNWTHIGCGKRWGGSPETKDSIVSPYFQFDLRHQVDSLTNWWLRTDHPDLSDEGLPADSQIVLYNNVYQNGTKWTGQNPFYHFRFGLEWKRSKLFRVRCPSIATGRSLTQGSPLESENGEADLYWSHVECNLRVGGK